MRRLGFFATSVALAVALMVNQANAVGERPYWPAYEERVVPEGCIKWNWQQLSYYNYCPSVVDPHRTRVLRVRG